jgi:hypothetical protein
MGQFKSMVKMKTDEPSVILKLKKGGHVASAHKDEHGHTNMKGDAFKAKHSMEERAEDGAAPKKPSMAERRKAMSGAMLNSNKGGKAAKHEDAAQDRAMIKKAMAGKKFAAGGTIEGNAGKFAKTKVVDGDKKDTAKGTGAIKMGKPAGYKTGGTIEGNEGKFVKTKVVDGDKKDTAKGTKGIKEGQPAGFKKGGAIGWENRPADDGDHFDSAHGTKGVREGNGGGYKKGGAAKKHFATGGSVNDAGRAVAMPRKPVSRPVANSLQSGTFKKGGKVKRFADGGMATTPGTPSAPGAPTMNYGGLNLPPSTGNTTPVPQAQQPLQQQQLPMDGMRPSMGNTTPVPQAQQPLQQQQLPMGGMRPPMMGGMGNMRPPMGGFGGMHGGFGGMHPPMMGGNVARPMPVGGPQPMYKRGGKVARKADGGQVQFADDQDMGNVSPQDVGDAKRRAKESSAIDKLLGKMPTQKQSIHVGGYKKGGKA